MLFITILFLQRCGHEEPAVAANDDMRQEKEGSNNKKTAPK